MILTANHILVKFGGNLKCTLPRYVKKLGEYFLSNPKTNKNTLISKNSKSPSLHKMRREVRFILYCESNHDLSCSK